MKLISLLIVTSFIVIATKFSYASDKLIPLSKIILEEQSVSRHLYVNERCAGLNQSIAGAFNKSTRDNAQKIAGALFLKAAEHSIYATTFAKKMGKNYTQQEALSRSLLFAKIYEKEMNRIYNLTGSSIGGIVKEDQEICNQIHSNGGTILIKNNQSKVNKTDRVRFDQFGLLEAIKIEEDIFKYDDKTEACSFNRTERYSSNTTSNYGLGVGFEKNTMVVVLYGQLLENNKIVSSASSINGNDLNLWQKVPKKNGVYLLHGKKGLDALLPIFEKYQNFMNLIIKNKDKPIGDQFLNDIPVMGFKIQDKEITTVFISQKWGELSKCVSKIIKKRLKK